MSGYRYEFCTLRYYHDVWTGEFLNIGVVLFCPEQTFLGWRIDHETQRPYFTFGAINEDLYQGFTKDLAYLLRQTSSNLKDSLDLLGKEGLSEILIKLLPHDDSSFQWGPMGGGITDSPEREFENLYDRYVGRYTWKGSEISGPLPLDHPRPK